MPTNSLSPLHALGNSAIVRLARRALLDWSFREQLVADPRAVLKAALDVEPAFRSELEAVSRRVTSLSAIDLSQELWREANPNGIDSNWQRLQGMIDLHLDPIKQLMLDIVHTLPSGQQYNDIICEMVEHWPGSFLRTLTPVLWPLAISQTVAPERIERVFPLAAACAFYYQGVVLFDDIADGELEPMCVQWPRGQVEHIAYSLAAALPFAALKRLEVSDSAVRRIVQDFAEAIWITNLGQYLDIAATSPVIHSVEAGEQIAQYKTARGIALLTRAATHCFELDEERARHWTESTQAFATARQIASDVRDIWNKTYSPDLFGGKCTLPIAYALSRLSGTALEDFQNLRQRCRYQHAPHAELRLLMEQMGALSFVEQKLDDYRAHGVALLEQAGASDTARAWIMPWGSQGSIFGGI